VEIFLTEIGMKSLETAIPRNSCLRKRGHPINLLVYH